MPLSQGERALAGRKGGHLSWARTTYRTARTSNGRATFDARFMRMVDELDPDKKLPESERERMAESFRSAYFADLAFRAAQARRQAVPS